MYGSVFICLSGIGLAEISYWMIPLLVKNQAKECFPFSQDVSYKCGLPVPFRPFSSTKNIISLCLAHHISTNLNYSAHHQMYLLLRSKNFKASNVVHRACIASHGYHTTRSSSSNLAFAYNQEKDQWSNENPDEEEIRKPAPPISRFDKPLLQLKDFYSNPEKVRSPRKSFAGSAKMPFIIHGKSDIRVLLEQNAPYLDWRSYQAAGEVFPTRTNTYILNNHINWSVSA
jgi:hypothetical protein